MGSGLVKFELTSRCALHDGGRWQRRRLGRSDGGWGSAGSGPGTRGARRQAGDEEEEGCWAGFGVGLGWEERKIEGGRERLGRSARSGWGKGKGEMAARTDGKGFLFSIPYFLVFSKQIIQIKSKKGQIDSNKIQ